MPELNVLVVDDSKTARYAMRKYLEHLHYLVETAASAMEAFKYLQHHRPDVIFLDNVMPEISGLDALYTLKRNKKTAVIPVFFCTSIETAEFSERARASGAIEVLRKPPSIEQLSRLLADVHPLAQSSAPFPPEPLPPAEEPAAAEAASPAALNNTEPAAAVPAPARYTELRHEIDSGMRKLTDEIFVQIAELKSQLTHLDPAGLTGQEIEAVRQIAREETEALYQSVQTELDAIRARLDTIARLQQEEREHMLQHARHIAVAEAHTLTERLAYSILKVLGRTPPDAH